MRVFASRVPPYLLIALLVSCARSARSEASVSAASAGGESRARGSLRADRRPREMTWDEYYVDVEQRAQRAGGFVRWFNPPRPIRRPAQSVGPDPTVDGTLSTPAR